MIHSMNTTRLTCANFTMMSSMATGTGSSMPSSTTSPPGFTGAASLVTGNAGIVGGVVFLLSLFL